MVMNRETSHHHACTSHGMDCPIFKKSSHHTPAEHVSPRATRIQRNLVELSLQDLLRLAKQLKYPNITTLRLSVRPENQQFVSQHFGSADQRTTDTLCVFSRALAHAIEGWMQNLELGVCLGLRDINTLCPAIRSSTTLRHLSFANSGLGDVTLQILSSCLQHCQSLQTLNLSGCALTDVATSVITAIVKGEDPNARSMQQNPKKTPPAEHRAPKYGQQWRQNVIMIGKWSPAPDLGDNLITQKTEVDWQTTLRKPTTVGSNNHHGNGIKPTKSINAGLVGLDLSHNSFTDALSEELCPLLYKKPPLRALNLRCNQMTRTGAKLLLDVMKELHILQLIDMRGNADESLLGVLEDGEHYTTFSTYQFPFWMDPESLDPIMCNPTKSQSDTPANRPRFPSLSKSSMPEKQTRATMASQHLSRDGTGRSRNLSPQNSSNVTNAGGSRNNTSSRKNKTPPNANDASPRANISPSCSRASISRTPVDHCGPSGRQKRYHCAHRGSSCVNPENEDVSVFNDHNRRCIFAPGKERPTSSSARASSQRSVWPESQRHINLSREQDFDTRFMSQGSLEPPREHPIWDTTTLHEFDMRDMKGPDGLGRRYTPYEGPRRAQSAGYNMHRPGYPRDYYNHHQDFYSEYGHQNSYRNVSASQSPSRSPWPSTIYNQGRGDSQGNRFREKPSPIIRCHHRCKLLKEVQEQKRNRSRAAKAAWLEEHGRLPCLHPLMPKVAFLPDDKKNLVEWNNFVNQMTATLLNLKVVSDGLGQLIGPSQGAVAQQAATKFHQMPSSFFRSGMLRLLERSCEVLDTHVTSLTKRHKKKLRHINSENQAPVGNEEFPNKERNSKVTIDEKAVTQEEKLVDKTPKTLQNAKQLSVQHSNHQHRIIYHPNLPQATK